MLHPMHFEKRDLYQEIKKEIEAQGYTLSSLSQKMSVNRGLLSGSLNRLSKPIPISLMDRLALALDHPEGWLYPEYIEECFQEGKAHWRRIKALLLRCLDLKKHDLVNTILDRLMEEPQHLAAVFKMAEELFLEGRRTDSIPFYRCVIENEIKQHSERFAISHYRWFRAEISKKLDVEGYQEAVMRFAPFRRRLPEPYQLDGLLHLANACFLLHKWDEVRDLAAEMLSLVKLILNRNKNRKRKENKTEYSIERHLVVYYGHSYLLCGNTLEKQGKFEQALEYVSAYQDLSWFDDLDDSGREDVRRFSIFADANRLNLYILMGKFEYLSEYLAFLDRHPEEKLPGLLTLLESSLYHQENIDTILPYFQQDITELVTRMDEDEGRTYYAPSFHRNHCTQLLYGLAIYSITRGRLEEGIDYLLLALQQCFSSNNKHLAIVCAAWFEKCRDQVSRNQVERYETIMEGVIQNEKMDVGFVAGPRYQRFDY
ncbi:DNA-binding protein [Gorillibacterium sp. CAU 1737]|uniref:DNA-binding protein n=1 Tax=Gorillibacterium sp. CAU 1737 TaxID=3140362 RepID=UPI00325FEE6C